jgi:lipopolysaccharide/colanic/teichoic acid biosynthesis glycosyltransferase
MSASSFVSTNLDNSKKDQTSLYLERYGVGLAKGPPTARASAATVHSLPFLVIRRLSSWSRSGAKRLFDCACVLPVLLLLVPVLLVIAMAVWLTSPGPVLFLQKRVGRNGRPFTILKFRTMIHVTDKTHNAVTTAASRSFTPVGPFLRRWKLDELPQLLNVLAGHMSLVGPRPKMPEHVNSNLPCRPGITGAATIAFAREEAVLGRVPEDQLEFFYHAVVLPAKRRLDARYMARATFLSDLRLIVDSTLRRWDCSFMESLLNAESFADEDTTLQLRGSHPEAALLCPKDQRLIDRDLRSSGASVLEYPQFDGADNVLLEQ